MPLPSPSRSSSSSHHFAVVVVGAGPVGGRVAQLIAQSGHSVLLVEEHRRPGWPVQCAGLITPRVFDIVDDRGSVQNEIVGARIFSPADHELVICADEPRALVVDRAKFDASIVEGALAAGAKLWLGARAVGARVVDHGVEVDIQRGGASHTVASRLLVGCDGVQSGVAKWVGLPRPKRVIHGFQAELAVRRLDPAIESDMVRMYTGRSIAPGFFAWLIPTPKTILLGLCIVHEKQPGRLKRLLGKSASPRDDAHTYYRGLFEVPAVARLLEGAAPIRYMAGAIPMGLVKRTYTDRVMLVGDAAAQAKPTSGGGIYTGLRCAQHCADTALEALEHDDCSAAMLAAYQERWMAELGDELKKGWRLHRTFEQLSDRDLERVFDLLDEPMILETISSRGDIDHPAQLAAVLFKKIPRLVRFAGPYLRALFE